MTDLAVFRAIFFQPFQKNSDKIRTRTVVTPENGNQKPDRQATENRIATTPEMLSKIGKISTAKPMNVGEFHPQEHFGTKTPRCVSRSGLMHRGQNPARCVRKRY